MDEADLSELTPPQLRVLGCLAEKEQTTPDVYPLTMNSVIAACNQTSNRTPVMALDEHTVQLALDNLRGRGLARVVHSTTGRSTTKYRHILDEALGVDGAELAVLCVLFLRGPQTVGELRTRTERLHPIATTAEVEDVLDRLHRREPPLALRLERQPGQKEARWAHGLGTEQTSIASFVETHHVATTGSGSDDRLAQLEDDVRALRDDLADLRQQINRLASL